MSPALVAGISRYEASNVTTRNADLGGGALSFSQLPAGWLAYCSGTVAGTVTSVISDLAGGGDSSKMSVTPTVAANRLIAIQYHTEWAANYGPSIGDSLTISVTRDGTTIDANRHSYTNIFDTHSFSGVVYDAAPSAGTHVYKLRGQCSAGGTFLNQAVSTTPCRLIVSDLGPSF